MTKRVQRILSVLCSVAMLLILMPEIAKASGDIDTEDIPDAEFYYDGGVIECKATESHGYEMTYRWIGGTSKDPATMTTMYAGEQTERTFVPPARLGDSYYMCQVYSEGQYKDTNVFKVTYKQILK